jgi:hypothetical protein
LKGVFSGFFAILLWGFFLRIEPIIMNPPNPGFSPYPLILFTVFLYVITFRSLQKTLQRMAEPAPEPEEKKPPRKKTSFVEARLKEEKMKERAY